MGTSVIVFFFFSFFSPHVKLFQETEMETVATDVMIQQMRSDSQNIICSPINALIPFHLSSS